MAAPGAGCVAHPRPPLRFFLAFREALSAGCVPPVVSGDYYYKISCANKDKDRRKLTESSFGMKFSK